MMKRNRSDDDDDDNNNNNNNNSLLLMCQVNSYNANYRHSTMYDKYW
jgi:hypothetical protein